RRGRRAREPLLDRRLHVGGGDSHVGLLLSRRPIPAHLTRGPTLLLTRQRRDHRQCRRYRRQSNTRAHPSHLFTSAPCANARFLCSTEKAKYGPWARSTVLAKFPANDRPDARSARGWWVVWRRTAWRTDRTGRWDRRRADADAAFSRRSAIRG